MDKELGKEQFLSLAAIEQPADIIDAVVGQAVALDVGRRQRLILALPILLEEACLDVPCVGQVVDGAMHGITAVGDDVSLLGVHLRCQLYGHHCQ